jgi:hypothetical protein
MNLKHLPTWCMALRLQLLGHMQQGVTRASRFDRDLL